MEQKQTDNKILQKFFKLLKWILFALFLLLALTFVSSLGNSILFLLCSLLVCPPIWDKIKNKFNPKKGLCGIIVTIMFLVSFFTVPTGPAEDTTIANSNNTRNNLNNKTELSSTLDTTVTIAPTNMPTSTPTIAPTSTPTLTPTVAPTNTPTSTPTVAPTSTPTSTPTVAPTNTPTSTPTVAPTNIPTPTPTVKATQRTYTLNTSTHKIHTTSCSEIKKMKDSNKDSWTGSSVDEFLKSHPDYTRCKKCNPN